MQEDFHYYATYCAAFLAGYSHEEAAEICYSAQFVDCCSPTFLKGIKGPASAATTQLQLELADVHMDPVSLQNMTRIWASFHFLPKDLHGSVPRGRNRNYRNKYRLICGPNGSLVADTVELAKGRSLQAVGVAMHVLADTWAHSYFAGTPSLVINNTNFQFYEILPEGERPVVFKHNPKAADDPKTGTYVGSIYQESENSIMNLGHGRAGHLPDYSFIKYRYLPAWGNYKEVVKDNPAEYRKAFSQMVYAMRYLRGRYSRFETDRYEDELLAQWDDEIRSIITKRQLNASEDWKRFGEKLSGREIPDFTIDRYRNEYMGTSGKDRDASAPGQFILAALAQKSMVTNRIYRSGNLLAGFSVEMKDRFTGIKDFEMLVDSLGGMADE